MSEYNSSEEFQRHRADVFAREQAKEKDTVTPESKLKALLDKYIAKHSSTKEVRAMATAANRTADEQLNLSADLVEILEKIKSDLR